MPKRLVVCCDGTWNTPDQLRGGRRAPTNVTKIALNVAPKDFSGKTSGRSTIGGSAPTALYRSRSSRTRPRSVEAQLFRRSYSYETRIRFIGVWDTVGSLGIPLRGLGLVNLLNRRWQFHDTDLSTTVDAAFQALAIDEKRAPFRPTVWKQANAVGQRLEQVWFAGVHSDVGGGYPDLALAEITLRWMVNRASAYGLVFEAGAFAPLPSGEDEALRHTGRYVAPDALGQLNESRRVCTDCSRRSSGTRPGHVP